jgi:hypothetical protein
MHIRNVFKEGKLDKDATIRLIIFFRCYKNLTA